MTARAAPAARRRSPWASRRIDRGRSPRRPRCPPPRPAARHPPGAHDPLGRGAIDPAGRPAGADGEQPHVGRQREEAEDDEHRPSGAPPLSCASVIRASNAAQPGNPKRRDAVTTSAQRRGAASGGSSPAGPGRWRDPNAVHGTAAHARAPVFVAASATSQIRAGPHAAGVERREAEQDARAVGDHDVAGHVPDVVLEERREGRPDRA